MLVSLWLAVSVAATATGFDKPESAFWDPATRSWYVSNVSGEENAKDGKGWISRLDADGKVVNARWVEGLNSPHGIRIDAETLYAADIDELVVVNVPGASVRARIKAPGAKFLNDVAVGPEGEVYVSDTLANTIYRCSKACEVFVKSDALEAPNGLLVDGDRLIVAAWGAITDEATFATKTPGRLLAVDRKSGKITPLGAGKPLGNLDGIEKRGTDYLVTDFNAGKLFLVSRSGVTTLLTAGLKESADLGYDPSRNLVGIPEMGPGRVQFLRIAR